MQFGSFEQFYEATWSGLRGFLRNRGGASHALDDLVQEAYLRFLSKPPRGTHFQQQKSYLYQIAIRLHIDAQRRNSPILPIAPGMELAIDSEPKIQALLDWEHLVETLNEKERNLLWLAYAEEFEHQEISKILGIQRGSVKVLLHRIKTKIKKHFHEG